MKPGSAIGVGGGFAGLTAGYSLRRAGWQLSLLEASGVGGGCVGTGCKQDYVFDAGATQMSAGYTEYPALCDDLGMLLDVTEHPDISLIWLEHNKNTDRVPPGHALFTVYSDEAANDQRYGLPDAELIESGAAYLERLFPESKGQRDFGHVTGWRMAIPNPAPGVYREGHAMKSRLDPDDPMQLAGDYFTCVGQNSAIYWGKLAAQRVLARAASQESRPGLAGARGLRRRDRGGFRQPQAARGRFVDKLAPAHRTHRQRLSAR